MYAGTLGLLSDPAPDPLESWAFEDGHTPALDVRTTQETLDSRPVQEGYAAARVSATAQEITIDGTRVETSSVKTVEVVSTGWLADVTGSGIVVAESVAADDEEYPFPFDLFTDRTGVKCKRQAIDVQDLSRSWHADDVLTDVWMVASRDETGEGVSIDYGENARLEDVDQASIGLGFERSYQGSVARGVCFEGGYAACYRKWSASKFVRFIEDELLPFSFEYEPGEEQVDFDEIFGDGSSP